MTNLTKKEIIAELRKLGVSAPSELKNYLRSYKKYHNPKQSIGESSQKLDIPAPFMPREIDDTPYNEAGADVIDSSLP